MTMVESIKAIILDPCSDEQQEISNYFQLSPIIFGSVITCAASILKFKKYQEKMEHIVKLVEKGNAIIGLLKKIREELTFCTNIDDYHSIENRFKSDAYDDYITNLQELERLLKDSDYDSYLHLIHNTDFKVHVLEQRRKIFFDNYLPDSNLSIDLSRKKKKCCLC